MSGEKFASMSWRAKSSGFSLPCCWNCLTRPGWPTDARSGGRPPDKAVDSTVGVLSPAGLYLTLTFGYCLLKASMTRWKFFCSCATQMPTTDRLPLTFLFDDVVLAPPERVDVLLLLLLPQPARAISAAIAARARTESGPLRLMIIRMLLSPGSRKCPGQYLDRRNAGCWCRRPLPRPRPP